MISRYEATLNGVALSSINADILVLDINYEPPRMRYDSISVAKRFGSRIYRKHIVSVSVSISFEIHTYDTQERQAICNAVAAWAKRGGVLETNDRDGQELVCVCTELPVIGSARNWTDPITMTFTAYEFPYWQEKEAVTLELSGTESGDSLQVPGNIDGAFVEVEIAVTGSLSTLSTISLTVNGKTLTLSDLSVASGQDIVISYDQQGIQSIKAGNTSLLDKRTGADDLLVNCGEVNSFAFVADESVRVTFSVKGAWA